MSDTYYAVVAIAAVVVFVVAVWATDPDRSRRNAHEDHQRPRWHTRPPR